jgi:hypothetical protein
MFIIINLQTVVDRMYVYYLRIKYLLPSSNISLVIAVKLQASENALSAAMLFNILQTNCFNKSCIFFDLLPYVIWEF